VTLVGPVAHARQNPGIDAYHGLATWVDVYDTKPWRNPAAIVQRLRSNRVKTLYLQTSNWQKRRDVMFRKQMGAYLDAAHASDINVVAWYVPSFRKPRVDLRRSLAAIRFESPRGERFDSFAMDIEADLVDDISKRNNRFITLSEKVRAAVGDDYSLGAIIPDPKTQKYWPQFPYRAVASLYDVVVPMSYFTFRTRGYEKVYRYTRDSLRIIRRETEMKDVAIHMIGGLAGDASPAEVKGFTRAVRKHGAVGASLYDLPLMTPGDFDRMQRIKLPSEKPHIAAAPVPARPHRFALPSRIFSALFL
jgi:hypothetical protein